MPFMHLFEYQDIVLGLTTRQWLGLILIVPLSYFFGLALERLSILIGQMLAKRTASEWDNEFVRLLPGPARLAISLLILLALLQPLRLPEMEVEPLFRMLIRSGLIIAAVWFAARFLTIGSRYLETRLTSKVTSDISRRAIHTQIAVPRLVLHFLLITVGVALVLWQFPVVRSVGAGVLGVAGLAAAAATLSTQRVLGNIFAGLQIAFSQPVKIGDTVMIEGELGAIEEITITYIVVKLWDLRRLILPMNYFIERPIQNWTMGSTKLLGTVTLHIDFSTTVDEMRAEFERILSAAPSWNGEAKELAVINLTATSAELRGVVSADDAGKLWELRCLVREKLLAWLQARKEAKG